MVSDRHTHAPCDERADASLTCWVFDAASVAICQSWWCV